MVWSRIFLYGCFAWGMIGGFGPGILSAQTPGTEPIQPSIEERIEYLESELRLLKEQTDPPVVFRNSDPYTAIATLPPDYPALLSQPEAKFPTVGLHGVFHVDAGWFHQDRESLATVGDLQDVVGFRRARLGANGKITQDISYFMEFDFAASVPLFTDLFVDIANVPEIGKLRIGRFRQPFGMDGMTSAKELAFLERGLTFPLNPFRQTGIGIFNATDDERLAWGASVYRFASDAFGNTEGDDGGYGMATRWTGLLVDSPDDHHLIHLGLGYAFMDPAAPTARFSMFPEFQNGQVIGGTYVGIPPFLDTGAVPTDFINLVGLEAGAISGPFSVQSEIRWLVLQQTNGPTEIISAAYMQVRYTLTGETLPYNRANRAFGRIVPDHPVDFSTGEWGAWEVAGRWSWGDFNGSSFPGPGRSLHDLTLGVNWYWNNHLKFQFNFIHCFLDDPIFGNSDTSIAALRGQLDF